MADAFALRSPEAPMLRWGVFSDDQRFRYVLGRKWDAAKPRALLIGLNPSIADHKVDDATIRKEIGFATRWGCGSFEKGNLYPLISTDPKGLLRAEDRAGEQGGRRNVGEIAEMARRSAFIVCCWGNSGGKIARIRAESMLETLRILGRPIYCLGRTLDGAPLHTVRLGYKAELEPFGGAA